MPIESSRIYDLLIVINSKPKRGKNWRRRGGLQSGYYFNSVTGHAFNKQNGQGGW